MLSGRVMTELEKIISTKRLMLDNSDIGWLHFLDESVAEPFGLVQTLIWTLHFGLSPDRRLAQAQPNCY